MVKKEKFTERIGTKRPEIIKASKEEEEEDNLRNEVNKMREKILNPLTSNAELKKLEYNRLSTGQEDVIMSGGGFQKHWWKFTKEQDGKVPLVERWFYIRLAGTGQPISLGSAFSLGLKWGAVVVTLPMLEVTLGYVPSPMTLK